VAEVRFEHDHYLPNDMVGIVYLVYTLGYGIEVRDPDNERIYGVPALIRGNRRTFFRLSPWAKEGVYVVRLFKGFVLEVDSDQMSVGVIIKKVVFYSLPSSAGVVTKKV
jgi:hypothetical protein